MGEGERTYTFVFTDIEGSTKLLRTLGGEYDRVLAEHDRILQSATTEHGGRPFGSEGDAQHLVFEDADSAVAAMAAAQRELAAHAWPEGNPIRVRMGIHTGTARADGDDFTGLALHETARVAAAGHGGQVLVSAAARELLRRDPPEGVAFRDLGEHRFKDLDEPVRVYQLDIEGLTSEFPPLRARAAAEARLPTQMTDFVGRAEVDAVSKALDSSRLVTLTGPGGTGKTRLSIEVAASVAARYADGAQFVALDAVTDPTLVASEIATALGLASGSEPPIERIIGYLGERSMLVVLDNLEQVIDAAGDVARIMERCPGVSFLATSRIPLRIYGERDIPVPALSLPPANARHPEDVAASEAVDLFIARAGAVGRGVTLDEETTPAVVDIVIRLDGLPLAIELAAARLRMLPLASLRDRLDDRLGTLTGGSRDRPGRQQTLRGAIEWSHELLDEPDRRLFARFGVIAGGAALPEIERICGPDDSLGRVVFDGLESLTEQSLVRPVDDGGEARFAMLATIREYARERLGESGEEADVARRHALAYLELAEQAAPQLTGSDGPRWTRRLEADHDDLRAALDWAEAAGEAEIALRLIAALWRFWQVRGHLQEGQERTARVLALPSVAEQDPACRARAEAAAGGIAYWRSDPASTFRHYTAALELARESGDRALIAEALYNKGFAVSEEDSGIGKYAAGEPFFLEALELYRELGDRPGEAGALWALHQVAESNRDTAESRRRARETLEIARELQSPFQIGWTAFTLGTSLALGGELVEAASLLEESLTVFVEGQDSGGILLNVATIGVAARLAGQDEAGWTLTGAAERIRRESGADLLQEAPGWVDIRREPENDAEQAAYDTGMRLSEEATIELAREVVKGIAAGRSTLADAAAVLRVAALVGVAGDEAAAAPAREERPGPAGHHEHPVLQSDEPEDVDAEPQEPGDEAAEA